MAAVRLVFLENDSTKKRDVSRAEVSTACYRRVRIPAHDVICTRTVIKMRGNGGYASRRPDVRDPF